MKGRVDCESWCPERVVQADVAVHASKPHTLLRLWPLVDLHLSGEKQQLDSQP